MRRVIGVYGDGEPELGGLRDARIHFRYFINESEKSVRLFYDTIKSLAN